MQDLQSFEGSGQFRRYGFAAGVGKKWMRRAEALRDRKIGNIFEHLASDEIGVPGDVLGWGLSKMGCATREDGCDRKYIKWVEQQVNGMKCKP